MRIREERMRIGNDKNGNERMVIGNGRMKRNKNRNERMKIGNESMK